MTDAPPPSLLITPDARRRLQQRYEEAVRLAAAEPCDYARMHELLSECLRADPGNILYLDALLSNLRRWGPKRTGWLTRLLGGPRRRTLHRKDASDSEILRLAPDYLRHYGDDAEVIRHLATAAGRCDLEEAELHYLFEARRLVPDDAATLRDLARALTRQGRFEEAVGPWFAVLALDPDEEANQAAEDLKKAVHAAPQPAAETAASHIADAVETSLLAAQELRAQGRLAEAEHHLTRAQQAAGGDLKILALREDLRLAHSQERLAMARARALADPHPKAQALVGRMENEQNRLEIEILHLRSERHPEDAAVRLELARRLKTAGNYSGAIQRLEEALVHAERSAAPLEAAVHLELGECWQHLRQYDKALAYYRQAVECHSAAPPGGSLAVEGVTGVGSGGDHRTTLAGALYRLGVLAAATNEPAEARAALTSLVAIEPDYKDARQRLDKLP